MFGVRRTYFDKVRVETVYANTALVNGPATHLHRGLRPSQQTVSSLAELMETRCTIPGVQLISSKYQFCFMYFYVFVTAVFVCHPLSLCLREKRELFKINGDKSESPCLKC